MSDTDVYERSSLVWQLRALGWALNLTRFNVILIVVTAALLTAGQGLDLLLTVVDDGYWWNLYGATLVWALSIWLWARVLTDIRFRDQPVSDALLLPYRKHLPRILGAFAFTVVAINLYRAVGLHAALWLLVAEGIAFYLFVVYRRAIGRWLARRVLAPGNPARSWAWVEEIEQGAVRPLYESLREAMGRIRGQIALATIVMGIGLLAWGLLSPLSLGQNFDTLFLLMLWGASVLPLGSLITYLGNRLGIPVVFIGIAVLIGFSAFNDNHQIRQLNPGQPAPERTDLRTALQQWQAEHCDDRQCPPMIVVATAGGGIRAAYWTGTLLGSLHDAIPGFDDHLFAISGVSGGSVGAAVYRGVAAAQPGKTTTAIQQILGQDYLGPVSAGLLYPDAIQRFLPSAILQDRAVVFEQGLEAGFRETIAQGEGLAGSFATSPTSTGKPWPALFLNSTWSDNGRRIVGATLDTAQYTPGRDTTNQVLFKDLLNTLGSDMPLSTAAHNSARFPVVSPPGGWQPADVPKNITGVDWQRLQDGGLFENFGAETAIELLKIAAAELGDRFRPLVVLISSDPTLVDNLAAFPYNRPLGIGYELLSTFRTYAQTRTGRGAEAASRLKAWALEEPDKRRFAAFRMCGLKPGETEPPLGWSLSLKAQTEINSYLTDDGACEQGNRESLERIRALMEGSV